MRYHIIFTTLLCVLLFKNISAQSSFCGVGSSTFYSANIFFGNDLNPTLDGQVLPFGSDIIVIYRHNDVWKCAGFAQWNGSTLSIVVNGDDGTLPGYQANEPYKYIVQLPDGCIIDSVTTTYEVSGVYTNPGMFLDGTFARLSSFHAISRDWAKLESLGGLCGENTAILEASTSSLGAPNMFVWNTGDTTATLSGVADGTYFVTITNAYGCSVVAQSEVTNIPAMNIQLNTQYLPDVVACQSVANVNGGSLPITYAWSNGQTGNIAINLSNGDFFLTVTDSNGCTSVQSDNCTISSVYDIPGLFRFSVSPNPACEFVSITSEFSGRISGFIHIMDAMGQIKLSSRLSEASNNLLFNVSVLPAGVYWVELKVDNRKLFEKLVVFRQG